MTTTTKQTEVSKSKAIAKFENIAENVLSRIEQFQADGGLTLPANYSVENHLKSAWLILQSTKDKNNRPALEVCTKDSIANALFDMVLQGLAVSKKQGFFIVYENKVDFIRSYFGTVALAKRTGGISKEPVSNIIYEDDEFDYLINPETAQITIIKHTQKLENIDNSKIKGVYALVKLADGSTQVTLMSMQQVRTAWNQGPTKGQSPAHKNFPDEMSKRTVINRACKMIINSSDDAWLYEGKNDEMDVDTVSKQREAAVNAGKAVVDTQDADYEDITNQVEEKPGEIKAAQLTVPAAAEEDDPGY